MKNSQALEIAESIFADAIKRRLVGGDYEEQALKTIRAALATPVGWRPIEGAPEGKDILVYCRETGECFVVFWALQMETKQGDWVIARANDGTCFICKNPTHWQPLPAPPHTEERG